MTKLKIISRLWSVIYDLKLYIDGNRNKSLEEIDNELDVLEYHCRPYADEDDIEEFQEGGSGVKIRAEPDAARYGG